MVQVDSQFCESIPEKDVDRAFVVYQNPPGCVIGHKHGHYQCVIMWVEYPSAVFFVEQDDKVYRMPYPLFQVILYGIYFLIPGFWGICIPARGGGAAFVKTTGFGGNLPQGRLMLGSGKAHSGHPPWSILCHLRLSLLRCTRGRPIRYSDD